jgi:hypothetical protein
MARAESQYLRIFDEDATYYRWQSYYINKRVTWESETWEYQKFDADGFTAGQTGDEGGISLTIPATAFVMSVIEESLRKGLLVELSMYEFDTLLGDDAPQAEQVKIASYVGEVVGGGGPFESVTIELGSSLSPVGAQVPPRTFTSRLIGVPCKL